MGNLPNQTTLRSNWHSQCSPTTVIADRRGIWVLKKSGERLVRIVWVGRCGASAPCPFNTPLIQHTAALQSEAPIVDNCIWGKRQLYHTLLIIQNRISNHIHVFVYGKGRIPCGWNSLFQPLGKVNRGQSWVVANLVGLVWWKIKTSQLESTLSASKQRAHSVFIRAFQEFTRFYLHQLVGRLVSWDFCQLYSIGARGY